MGVIYANAGENEKAIEATRKAYELRDRVSEREKLYITEHYYQTVTGELEKAQLLFEKMLGYANHLGLYSEELGADGRHLGNFPQAFTHLALISAATYLDRELSGHSDAVWR